MTHLMSYLLLLCFLLVMFVCFSVKTTKHTHTHTHFRIICTEWFVAVEDTVAFIQFNGDTVTGINI